MQEKHHRISIIDFITTDHKTIYVKLVGFDAELGNNFEEEVRFLDGMPYGDLIHPERSPLSDSCREYVRDYLIDKYNKGEFE